jgi:signal peptidase I
VSNVRETLESLIIGFVLALIFRAFIVEPFVIPTGSMAPTLLGAHTRFVCPDCGYQFDVNYSSPPSPDGNRDDTVIRSPTVLDVDVHCPNCGYLVAPRGTASPAGGVSDERSIQPVNYGDRILVLKYAYLVAPPQRWDVVVFKAPAEPEKYDYSQNYIKRLVGLPGDMLEVLDGELFVSADEGATWTIQTRPRSVQDALWRIVYDNDYYPQQLQRSAAGVGENPWKQPWQPEAGSVGWNVGVDAATGRVFHFDSTSGTGTLVYNPVAIQTSQTLTDYLAYDLGRNGNIRRPNPDGEGSRDDSDRNNVSDLKLSLTYSRQGGDGPLQLGLTKINDTFTAEFTANTATVTHDSRAGHSVIGQPVAFDGAPGRSHAIDFVNVDYKVTLRIDGVDVITSTPQEYAPDVNALQQAWKQEVSFPQPRVSITASNQQASLSHISLWRNIYYTNSRSNPDLVWGTPRNPVQLGPDEYFTMGDNSLISADARYWNSPIDLPHEGLNVQAGRVPARFMLGKAFFVYWPAGQRILGPNGYAVIPNFADMRFIH